MTLKRIRITRTMMVIAALALMAVIAGSALAAESVTQEVSGGDRSASVSGVDLGTVDYSHETQSSSGTISLQVDDSTGSDAGWNVTLQASDFTDGDRVIEAGNFAVVNAQSPGLVVGQEIDPANGPMVASSATGSLASERKVLQSNAGYGKGTYSQDLDVQLLVPGQTLAGNYGANLTVNITAGP
jgi:hypothetical protein